jgi:hypothetical protein
MMYMKTLAAAAALALPAAAAQATPVQPDELTFISCVGTGYDISTKAHEATDCTIATNVDQDFLETDPMTVNITPGFFDITDWVFLGKDETGGQSGSYDFSALLGTLVLDPGEVIDQLMLVFKSGAGTTLVGYLVPDGAGDWDTPFTEPPFSFPGNDDKDVSHISAYYTTKTAVIPVPAAGLMLLGALGGLALARRRRA